MRTVGASEARDRHHAVRLLRAVVRDDQQLGAAQPDGLQDVLLGVVAPEHAPPLGLGLARGGGGERDDRERHARAVEHVDELFGGVAVARHDHVVLQVREVLGLDCRCLGLARVVLALAKARRDSSGVGHQDGRERHRHDRHGDKERRAHIVHPERRQPDLAARALEDERELAHLGERERRGRRDRRGPPDRPDGHERRRQLEDEDERERAEDEQDVVDQKADIE